MDARWRLPHWYEAIPELVVGVGLAVFFVDETDAALSAFKSGRALLLMGATIAIWLVARVLLDRFVRRPVVRVALLGGAALGILAVVVLPAYHDTRVVETLARAGAEPTATTTGSATTGPSIPGSTTTAPPADPALVRTATFRGIDHRATGNVNIYRRGDGRYIIGLEDFDIQPGPDYDVYVVPGANRESRDHGVRVDDLRGNQGTQFYDVPASTNLEEGEWTVLVWCQTFAVPVANATPA